MSYVRAAVAAAVIALATSCAPKLYHASEVHDQGDYIGFRVKKGNCVYQVLKHGEEAWVEMARNCGLVIEWVPVGKKPITPELEQIFDQVKEEGRTQVDIAHVID